MHQRALLACAGLSLIATPTLANDATFGGAGADLVPLSEQQVQMKSEEVVLTAREHEWWVQADYVFFNPGPALTVQVGFPEYRCEAESDCTNVAFRDLQTVVDGVAVQHRKGTLDKKHQWADFLGVVWLFDVTFPQQKEVQVSHSYKLSSGGNVEGNQFTSYVTRTGRGWAGPIGSAKFTAIFPPYARVVFEPQVKGLQATAPRLITEGTPRIELVLTGKNWTPSGGLTFTFNDSAMLSFEPLESALKKSELLPLREWCPPSSSVELLQQCLNDQYAAKGYPFKSAALQQRYYKGNPQFRRLFLGGQPIWARDASPLAAFTPAWFSSNQAQWLKAWSAELAARGKSSGPGSATPAASLELPLPTANPLAPVPNSSNLAPTPPAVEREQTAPDLPPTAPHTPSPSAPAASTVSAVTTVAPAPEAGTPKTTAWCAYSVGHRSFASPGTWWLLLCGAVLLQRRRVCNIAVRS